jgi:hypothetical protein
VLNLKDNYEKSRETFIRFRALKNIKRGTKSVECAAEDQEKTFPKSKNRKRLKAFADNTYRELLLKV